MAANSMFGNPELRAALDHLFSLQTFGIKLGLDPIRALLEEIDNPQRTFRSIHVAGTNGKGSVCAMTASILTAAGYRVGLYSSPHLVSFQERIRVDGVPIDEETLARYAAEMLPLIDKHSCTFFEGTTAIGFRYFAEQKVDVAIIETGMGGRLDATNILSPLISAITSISFDHTKHLGDTLEKIAAEKGGIIKPDTPSIIGPVPSFLRPVFIAAAEKGPAPIFVDDRYRGLYRSMTFDGVTASFMLDGRELSDLLIDLPGRYQIDNARVALAVIESVRQHFDVDDDAIRRGLGSIRKNTGLQGRFQSIGSEPRIILDVAHNPAGAQVLVDTLSELIRGTSRNVLVVYGAVQDKDVAEILRLLQPVITHLFAVRADSHRSLPADEIAYHATHTGIETTVAGSVERGIELARASAGADDLIIVCGSFYVVADAITAFDSSDGDIVREVHERHYDAPPANPVEEERSAHAVPNDAEPTALASKRLTVKEWSPAEQPRERLMKLGPAALSDAELLAILLRTGTKQEDVIQVSRNIIHRFRTSTELSSRDYRELQQISGVGPTKAVTLAAAFEIGRRIESDPFASRPVIGGPADVARIFVPKLRGVQKEQFHVLILNTANQVIRMEPISEGNLNSSIVHPREVFRTAIIENAAAIIGLHNHPSGNPSPSREDIAITKQLVEAGRIIGIPFHDHIIIAGEEYVSLSEKGYV